MAVLQRNTAVSRELKGQVSPKEIGMESLETQRRRALSQNRGVPLFPHFFQVPFHHRLQGPGNHDIMNPSPISLQGPVIALLCSRENTILGKQLVGGTGRLR